MSTNRNLLHNLYLFKTMSPTEFEAVTAISEVKPFNAGDTIFIRGESAKAMYLVKSGTIKIQQSTKAGDAIDIATLTSGSHFGEMSFVDGQPRSATASSVERGELVVIPYDKLSQVLDKNPATAVKFYHELAHFLCGRLRVTTNDLSFTKEQNVSHF